MKVVSIIFISLISFSTFAGELPAWVEKSSKLQSYEQLVEWMQNDKFYRISRTESKEVKIDSGQVAQKTNIFFDDVSGCKDRTVTSTCVPIGQDTDKPALFCFNALTDCMGNRLLKSQRISK